jgi:hypothetical protein
MESGLYMKPLSDKESVVECLSDLIHLYEIKTGIHYDSLVMKACEVGLKFKPISTLQCNKADVLKYRLEEAIQQKGLKKEDYKQLPNFPDLKALYKEYDTTRVFIKEMGYAFLTQKQYQEKLFFVEEEREKEEEKAIETAATKTSQKTKTKNK